MKNILLVNQSLKANEFIISNNHMYKLVMQPDGNLVLYDIFTKAIWSSKTNGKGGVEVIMQADGNLVVYTKEGKPVWASNTDKKGGVKLAMQDDRNLVIYTKDEKAVWASNTDNNIQYAPRWMQNNLDTIGDKKISEICITGSHDSGTKARNGGTPFANECNTKTQSNGILDQLCCGSRYFDIRPVIHSGNYYTGHYQEINVGKTMKNIENTIFDGTGKIPIVGKWIKKNLKKYFPSPPDMITWQGANGQSIGSIINDINTFTELNNEFIILNVSHSLNTDVGNSKYRAFNQTEWDKLFEKLSGLNNLLILEETTDITSLKLGDIISSKSAVVIIIEPSKVDIGSFFGKGFYKYSSFDVINRYSGENSFDKMLKDQVSKMNQYKNDYFLLSWTLTLSDEQVVKCILPNKFKIPIYGDITLFDKTCILDLANKANSKLSEILKYITPSNKPNIVYVDNVVDNLSADLAMKINNAPAFIGKSVLEKEDVLKQNEFIATQNGAYKLIMQIDGNLVMYNIFEQAIWSTKTNGKGGFEVVMQADGNLVVYTKDGKPVWASNTDKKGGVKLAMQDDRNLVIYTKDEKAVWDSKTNI